MIQMKTISLLSCAALALAACGDSQPDRCLPSAEAVTFGLDSTRTLLATTADAERPDGFGADVDGDGFRENKLGGVLAIFTGLEVEAAKNPLPTSITPAVPRLTVRASDACVGFTFGSATLAGATRNPGLFDSGPVQRQSPIEIPILLALVPGEPPLQLTLRATRFRASVDANTQSVTNATLVGAVATADVENLVVPALARAFTAFLADPAVGQFTKNLITETVDEGCIDPTQGSANDGRVDICEITEADFAKTLIPDLDLFADTGAFDPRATTRNAPANDSLSFGFGVEF